MSQAANPNCPVTLFTPSGNDPHSEAHPMVQLPSDVTTPFTLIKGNNGLYSITFSNQISASEHNGNATARIFVASFVSRVADKTWFNTVDVAPGQQGSVSVGTPALSGAAHIWVGAWWANGPYGTDSTQVGNYFAAHPEGGNHHTVPILVG